MNNFMCFCGSDSCEESDVTIFGLHTEKFLICKKCGLIFNKRLYNITNVFNAKTVRLV